MVECENQATNFEELLQIIQEEVESLDNIYSGENVIAAQPQIIQVAKHVLEEKEAEESKVMINSTESLAVPQKPSIAQIRLQQHITALKNKDNAQEPKPKEQQAEQQVEQQQP